MAAKLFKLRHVPDDEAEDIRQLLHEHEIGFYETDAGGWGISVPAIWLHEKADLDQANDLIKVYQMQRAEQAQAQYQLDKEQGLQPTVLDKVLQNPLQVVLLVTLCLFILYVTLAPFIDFLK